MFMREVQTSLLLLENCESYRNAGYIFRCCRFARKGNGGLASHGYFIDVIILIGVGVLMMSVGIFK